MPVYEYRCQSCGHELEATQRIVDPPLSECPACRQPQLERLISATSFQLKGSGWYKDGYGSKKSKERSENQVGDRLTKAVDDDKKKTATSDDAGPSPSSPSTASSESSTSSASPDTSAKSATTATSGSSSEGKSKAA